MSKNSQIQAYPSLEDLKVLLQKSSKNGMDDKLVEQIKDDPFLMDALEGLSEIENTHDLALRIRKIKRIINHKARFRQLKNVRKIKRRSRVNPISYNFPPYITIGIAASVAILLAFIVLKPSINTQTDSTIAMNKSPKFEQQVEIEEIPSKDFIRVDPFQKAEPSSESLISARKKNITENNFIEKDESKGTEFSDTPSLNRKGLAGTLSNRDIEKKEDLTIPQQPILSPSSTQPLFDKDPLSSANSPKLQMDESKSISEADAKNEEAALNTLNPLPKSETVPDSSESFILPRKFTQNNRYFNFDTVNYPDIYAPDSKNFSISVHSFGAKKTEKDRDYDNKITLGLKDRVYQSPEDSLFGVLDKKRVVRELLIEAETFIELAQFQEANIVLEEILDIYPTFSRAILLKAITHKKLQEWKESEDLLKLLIKLEKTTGETIQNSNSEKINYYLRATWELATLYRIYGKSKLVKKLCEELLAYPTYHERADSLISHINN